MDFTIPAAITNALKAVDPQAQVTIDLPTKHVSVQTTQSQSAVTAVLAEAGYPVA